MKFKYGDRVSISKKLRRVQRSEMRLNEFTVKSQEVSLKIWITHDFCRTNCIFLGERTLSNGSRGYDMDYGYIYYPVDYFKAALVSPGPNESPVYVPFEFIEAES
jgi:hypothetical protein